MLGYMPAITTKGLLNRFADIRFLIGNYRMEVFNYREFEGWYSTGNGNSTISMEDQIIVEQLQLNRENKRVAIQNTIVIKGANLGFKLLSLDLGEGRMDTYSGIVNNGVLTFNNEEVVNSDQNPTCIFKLIYKEISVNSLSLIIGSSKDKGKTWMPFIKNIYYRLH